MPVCWGGTGCRNETTARAASAKGERWTTPGHFTLLAPPEYSEVYGTQRRKLCVFADRVDDEDAAVRELIYSEKYHAKQRGCVIIWLPHLMLHFQRSGQSGVS